MKIHTAILSLLLSVCFLTAASPKTETPTPPDYIESRYYTRVAEAQIAYLQEDYAEAYRILLDLEAEIPLLNNVGPYEMPMLVELCLRYGDYEKAYAYMKSLVTDHGFSISIFKDYENLDLLKRQPFYDSSALARAEANFIPADSVLFQEIWKFLEVDMAYRNSLNEWPRSDSAVAGLRYVDSCSFYRFKELLAQYGFPLAQNKRLNVMQRGRMHAALSTLLIHWNDSAYMEFLVPIVYQCVKSGDCPPEFLGNMFDSRARGEDCFPYGMYMNAGKEVICDVEHLDERRAEIGLPPHRLYCQIAMLMWKKGSNDTTHMFNCDF